MKTMTLSHKIVPHLWFESQEQAQEAAEFYTSIFKNSRIVRTTYYGHEGFEVHKMPAGAVLTIEFEIEGQPFIALNGGPQPRFNFNESISFLVHCNTQQEIDYYWDSLTAGGDPAAQQCGWLKDKFGLSWQVSPPALAAMLADKDRDRADRVMKVMLGMKKIEIEPLRNAYRNEKLRKHAETETVGIP